jgi:hypothetical protein
LKAENIIPPAGPDGKTFERILSRKVLTLWQKSDILCLQYILKESEVSMMTAERRNMKAEYRMMTSVCVL